MTNKIDEWIEEARKRDDQIQKIIGYLKLPAERALKQKSMIREVGNPPPNVEIYWRTGSDTAQEILELDIPTFPSRALEALKVAVETLKIYGHTRSSWAQDALVQIERILHDGQD